MITRDLSTACLRLAQGFPVLTITGPRQSGKTTLAQTLFSDKPYINLEHPQQRQLALDDPEALLTIHAEGCIIDEIQHAPDLMSYLQVRVDAQRTPGRYILTGSQQLALSQSISQSLAGRTGILTLLPLSAHECRDQGLSTHELMLRGGYPGLYQNNTLTKDDFFSNYIATYIERDVRSLSAIQNLSSFRRFLHVLAGRCGQILNKESLGNDLGLTGQTIENWLSILEASYLIFRLPPYFENIGKRLIKSPKLYFYDVGLVCYLLGIRDEKALRLHPAYGALYENWAILEVMKAYHHAGKNPDLFFFRDQSGHEVDLLILGPQMIAVEIKASHTYNRRFRKNLDYVQTLLGPDRFAKPWLIYQGNCDLYPSDLRYLHVLDVAGALEDHNP